MTTDQEKALRDPASASGEVVTVPREPTEAMLNAAIDVDSFKLGDISPLGFRCSPQQLFERCWIAMLAAAPVITPPDADPASIAIGGWLSAALDDPKVCDAMKADINAWFEAGMSTPFPVSEVDQIREALVGVSDDYMTSENHHPGHVLIPVARFDKLVAAESSVAAAAPEAATPSPDTGGEHIAGAGPLLRCVFDEDCQKLATCAWRTVDGRYFPACDDCSAKTSARYPITMLRVYARHPTPAAPSTEVASGGIFTAEGIAAARRETERLGRELDITNADHVALWLEANLGDASLGWLAVRIVEAHEAALSPASDVPPIASSGEAVLDRRRREVSAEQDALQGYLANYVMSTEGADYQPTEHERALIEDAMQGWLVDRERLMAEHGFAETWQQRHAAAFTPPAASSGQDLRDKLAELRDRLWFEPATADLQVEAANAIAALLSAPAVQPGGDLVVVPREPTEAMLAAAAEAFPRSATFVFPKLWRAMLAATPQPEAEEGA